MTPLEHYIKAQRKVSLIQIAVMVVLVVAVTFIAYGNGKSSGKTEGRSSCKDLVTTSRQYVKSEITVGALHEDLPFNYFNSVIAALNRCEP